MNGNDDRVQVKLWFVEELPSGRARLYAKSPTATKQDQIWIPISQITSTTRFPAKGRDWPMHIVTMTQWIADQKGLT